MPSVTPSDEAVVFQCMSWHWEDMQLEDENGTSNQKLNIVIKAFGVDMDGKSHSVSVLGFRPYFFVDQNHPSINQFSSTVLRSGGDMRIQHVIKKDFWGFQADDTKPVLKVECRSMRAFRIAASEASTLGLTVYESNLDPVLRFIHVQNLAPCGWVRIAPHKHAPNNTILPTKCCYDIKCDWAAVLPLPSDDARSHCIAPIKVLSYDIECTSSHGDFPVAIKSYAKLASELYAEFQGKETYQKYCLLTWLRGCLLAAFGFDAKGDYAGKISRVFLDEDVCEEQIHKLITARGEDIINILSRKRRCHVVLKSDKTSDRGPVWNVIKGKGGVRCESIPPHEQSKRSKDEILEDVNIRLCSVFPRRIKGDEIIQIGTTVHTYGEQAPSYRHIVTLGGCDDIPGATVKACKLESELLMTWAKTVESIDPDVVTGYNILGFDFTYIRERAEELGIAPHIEKLISRIRGKRCMFKTNVLASSALGENILKFYDMPGRCIIDLMKVVRRDHSLDSYKLDHVAERFLGERKHDVSPGDIFRLQTGSDADRATIAEYCLQDCALVNRLLIKLETLANNIGMANVCLVPLSYIFLRGQGIKVFSLVAKECASEGYIIPARTFEERLATQDDGYEGAIVLEPQTGMYFDDVVSVMDYNSLYPCSIISENLSHDTLVLDSKYDNLDGVEYNEVIYDIYMGSGEDRVSVGQRKCRFATSKTGMIPRILQKLLLARKTTRKRISHKKGVTRSGMTVCGALSDDGLSITDADGEQHALDASVPVTDAHDGFAKAVLEGLQLAYKVTANSIYGQMGARTSHIYLKDIAACTTAVGRGMIQKAKEFMETHYNANVIYGDTDSIFCVFPRNPDASTKEALLQHAMNLSETATNAFNKTLKAPQYLEAEKCFYPFVLLSKKRYIGMMYPQGSMHGKRKEMGVALKRRDNAPIVKHVLGGIVDIILKERNLAASVEFLRSCLHDLIQNKFDVNDLIVTKSLRATYSDPTRIAHKVLAERMGERDPGSKPQANDRIKYVYIRNPSARLQGDRIETPEFIAQHNIPIDYRHYITNQIMNPVVQLYAIVLELLPQYRSKPVQMTLDGKRAPTIFDATDKKSREKAQALREKEVERLLFTPILDKLDKTLPVEFMRTHNASRKQHSITSFYQDNDDQSDAESV